MIRKKILLCILLLLVSQVGLTQSSVEALISEFKNAPSNVEGPMVQSMLKISKVMAKTPYSDIGAGIKKDLLEPSILFGTSEDPVQHLILLNSSRDNHVLNLDLSALGQLRVVLQLFDELGREVYWDQVSADVKPLHFALAGLPKGKYFLNIEYDKKQHVERFVLD